VVLFAVEVDLVLSTGCRGVGSLLLWRCKSGGFLAALQFWWGFANSGGFSPSMCAWCAISSGGARVLVMEESRFSGGCSGGVLF
jgi:hypothetical protein